MKNPTITVYLNGGEEQEMPARYKLCPTCEGRGMQALHGIAITAEEWNSPDWDDESREQYLNGGYDTPCTECNGRRVVAVPDRTRATPEQLAAYNDWLEFKREEARERYYESRMLGEWD